MDEKAVLSENMLLDVIIQLNSAQQMNQHSSLDLILQHLSYSELLKLSLTSPQVNQLVENSNRFIEKTEITIKDGALRRKGRENLYDVMKKSERTYKNINIKAEVIGVEELGLLLRNKWTNATISIDKIISTCRYVKYLGLIMPTLKSLNLSIGRIEKVNPSMKLDIPALEVLNIADCSSSALEIFVRSENDELMKKLTLNGVRQSVANNSMSISRIFTRFIQTFTALVHLDIGSSANASEFFKSDVSENTRFHLKVFGVVAPSSLESTKNIEEFIKSQGSSLEELYLSSWNRTVTIYKIWVSMLALRVFKMSNHATASEFEEMNRVCILSKKKLHSLHFDFPKSEISIGYMQPLLQATMFNLDSLHINALSMKSDLLQFIKGASTKVILNGTVIDTVNLEPGLIDKTSADNSYDSSDSSCVFTPNEIETIIVSDSD